MSLRASHLLLLTAIVCIAACCPTPRNPPVPPPPISIQQQVGQLNRWSRSLPLLKATMNFDSGRFDYRDDDAKHHSETANVTLAIRQHLDPPSAADVYLRGLVIGNPAFEAGRNAQTWWFAIQLDRKTAWVGDATRPPDLSALGRKQSQSVLRADIVPQLLGLTELPAPDAPPASGQVILMQENDALNDLLVVRLPSASDQSPIATPAFITRDIRIDRFTGHITEVRIYDSSGLLVVRSELSNYAPVRYTGGAAPVFPGEVPQFPRKIIVTYPAQDAKITLNFDDVVIPATIPNAAFEPALEGLKIIHEN